MSIGERIKYFRTNSFITQKALGSAVGFPYHTADIRMAQYESGARTPKDKILTAIADELGVSPLALQVPDIDSLFGLMHTLFALEDIYGFRIRKVDNEIQLVLDENKAATSQALFAMMDAWNSAREEFKPDENPDINYNTWRYNFPYCDEKKTWEILTEAQIENEYNKHFKAKEQPENFSFTDFYKFIDKMQKNK